METNKALTINFQINLQLFDTRLDYAVKHVINDIFYDNNQGKTKMVATYKSDMILPVEVVIQAIQQVLPYMKITLERTRDLAAYKFIERIHFDWTPAQ